MDEFHSNEARTCSVIWTESADTVGKQTPQPTYLLHMTLKQIAELQEAHPDMTLAELATIKEEEHNVYSGLDPLEEDHPSPVNRTLLKAIPELDAFDKPEILSPHLKNDATTPDGVMNFGAEPMTAANPTIPGLPPDELIDRTFLLPPEQDGT